VRPGDHAADRSAGAAPRRFCFARMGEAPGFVSLCMESGGSATERDTAWAMSQERSEIRETRSALPPLNQKTSQRRTLDEHVYVRFPAVAHLLANALFRLPQRSRFRRRIIAHRLRRAYAAANRRDFDVVLVGWDLPSSEYRPSADLIAPDQDHVFYGRDGYLRMWRTWLDAFEDLRFEPEELLDLGDMLLVTAQIEGHGSGSGVAVGQRVFQLFSLRQGLVRKQEDFVDHVQALEAAGLRE
jgi:ketosteroid isomerase-like protein